MVLVLLLVPLAGRARAAPDAGPPARDAGATRDASSAADGAPDAAVPPDAGPVDWRTARVGQLQAQLARLRSRAEAWGELEPLRALPPKELAGKTDFGDPKQVEELLAPLAARQARVKGQIEEQRGRLELVTAQLRRPIARLERLEKRKARYPRLRIPEKIEAEGTEARRRLELMQLELQVLQAEASELDARQGYLEASQPVRLAAWKEAREAEQQSGRAKLAAEREQQKAAAESVNADRARLQALEEQRRARTEAARLLAAERARLAGVRGNQARLKEQLARDKTAQIKLRGHLNQFRGTVSRRLDELKDGWPGNAPRYDRLYDEVVAELIKLRPRAIDSLKQMIKGLPDPPHPGEKLSGPIYRLDDLYKKEVKTLEAQRAARAKAADKLATSQKALYQERLAMLQREITALNEQRIAILARVTPEKRSSLSGVTQATIGQLSREISQLVFDGLYWAYRRLHQIDEVPRLIIDIFTVGSVLWKTLKLIFLLFLLRFLLKRWDPWLQAAVTRVSRSVSLGRRALTLAKLIDILRHSGPALLVLIFASVIYEIFGGGEAAVELTTVYTVFFWVAVYRVQLRVVESLAKYTGMERALRAADEGVLEEVEPEPEEPGAELEGPPDPRAAAAPLKEKAAPVLIVPASALLVRSVRAATRYILAVVLVLELTALAVGKGTFYLLTARFSWWAALPFVFYFLHLWRPHVERTYRERFADDGKETVLERLVRRAKGKTYGVFVIGAAVFVLLGNRLASFARRYLTSLDATKKLLAFLFRRQVEKHAQQLGRVVAKRQELPEAVLTSFPMGPVGDGMAYRQGFVDELKEVFSNWQEDRSDGSAALVGHTGMGKTTVLEGLERELGVAVLRGDPRTKIMRPAKVVSWLSEVFGFSPRPSSEGELVKLIREDTRPVVAIDNCHNLFLRQVGGFEGWDAFVRVVNETCDNVFWVLSFNAVAWDYLQNITGRARFFRRVVHLPPWTEREIRRMIMVRMRRAGYGVSFSDLVVAGVEGMAVSAQLGRTSEGYFRLLWDFTGGNPQLSSYFWLNSLVPEPDERRVKVHLFSMPAISELEALPDDVVFVLTAVAQHQNLTPAEAARATNLSRDYCNFAFRFCLENEYLFHEKESGRSRLSMRWQRPIQRFLKRKHLLYDV